MKKVKIQAVDDVSIEGVHLARGAQREVAEDIARQAAITGRVIILPAAETAVADPAPENASANPVAK